MSEDIVRSEFILDRGGRKLPVYVSEPDSRESLPALILIHEIFGVNEHILDVCDRFAGEGLRVYAPQLFSSSPEFPADPAGRADLDTMRKVWGSIADSKMIEDLNELFKRVHQSSTVRSGGIGTIGYCMGGAIAFMFACSNREMAYVIDYYGRIEYPSTSPLKPKHPVDYIEELRCPFLGIFSGIDELIPADDRAVLKERLEELKVPYTIKVFDNAPHAFFNDTRENYREDAAREAWKMTLQFINEHSHANAGQKG